MPRALLSVSDKTGLVDLARGLVQRGFELVSTGGTARTLADAGLPVVGISTVTGFPEMMDGRVKTLHPNIHAGILARRDHAEDLAALESHGIAPVDVVVVNLYPFAETAANPSATFDELVEKIDIGGPSMVRAAAKNFPGVLVLVDPGDYGAVLAALDAPGGPTPAFRFDLARKAIAHTAAYDTAITATLAGIATDGGTFRREAPAEGGLPARLELGLTKIGDLRYGENPHQQGAWYGAGLAAGLGHAQVLQGKGLWYTNLLDLDAAARIALEFEEPAAAVIKHTNPCGVATGQAIEEAYVRARDADALSAFGGIVGLNRPIDEATAREIVATFIEAVVAPGADEAALRVLAAKSKMRVVIADFRPLARGGGGAGRDRELRIAARRRAGAGPRLGARGAAALDARGAARGGPGRHEAEADRRGVAGAALRLAGLRAREVEHDHLHEPRPDAGDRGGADEPRRRREAGRDEGRSRRRCRRAGGARRIGGGVGRLLPVPRRARCHCGRRGDGRRSAGRVGARCRGDCRGRRARPGHGLHGAEALPALRGAIGGQRRT